MVLFVNGLPLAVLELKNAAAENATIWSALQQFQTYKAEIPSLFAPNALLVVSDGVEARAGTLTAGREWFKPWRTIAGEGLADPHLPELEVVIEGLFAPQRFLNLVRDFIVFDDDGSGRIVKKVELYRELVRLRPNWHHEDDERGAIKVVMTGSAADPADWQPHIRTKQRREALANRFRDNDDPLRLVFLRDMWLTGFDAP